MALTFSRLRDSSNRSLELQETRIRANETLVESSEGQAKGRLMARIRYARGRTQELLTNRADVENLASTQAQRSLYGGDEGAERWQRDFVLLRDLHENAHVNVEGEVLRHFVWSKVPNSRFKRFQELFVRPEHLAVPRFEITKDGDVEFGAVDFNAISLLGCLVSADRIPDDLAESLKLCDFTEENGDPFARLQKKADIIPELKKIWESTRQLQKGHHRLLAVEEPLPDVDSLYPGIRGPDPSVLGTVLYVREHENGHTMQTRAKKAAPPPRNLVVQHYESVYGAYRKTKREEITYDREITALTEMAGDIAHLNRRIDTQWMDASLRDELRSTAGTIGLRCIDLLKKCENKYKIQARDLIEKFVDLKDASDRENVTVALSRMVAAINRFSKRFEDMDPKGGYNQRDRMVLKRQITAHEKGLGDYRTALEAASTHILNGLALLNPAVKLSDAQRSSNVLGVERRLDLSPDRLSPVQLRPFRTYRDALGHEYAGLHAALEDRDRNGAIDQAIKMHVIGKYQEVRVCFERMKECTLDPENIAVSNIRTFVTTLRNIFAERQIFPDHTVPSYAAPFDAMCRNLKAIEDRLAWYEGSDLDVSHRTEIYKKLKSYLDTFDIENIVRSLQ